jgi:bifunctional DNase/RNase
MITQMNVRGLLFDPYNNAYIIILRDEQNSDMLPIWVGKSEASAISFALENVATPRPMTHDLMKSTLENVATPRPMTHDLMKSILDNVDAKVLSAVVTDLKDNTYYAKIHLWYGDSEYSIDSRPSDAIALALRAEAPIFTREEVLQKQSSEELERWLENLKPEDFGKFET